MIAELCKKHDVVVFSDEVYEWVIYVPNKHIKIGGSLTNTTEQRHKLIYCKSQWDVMPSRMIWLSFVLHG